MTVQLPSGLNKFEGTDNVTRDAFNAQWDTLDALLRQYKEEVDLATKDEAAGIYTTVRYRRPNDNTLQMLAVLSNKVGGYYLTDTWTFYAEDGTTPVRTITWTLTYDVDGLVIGKVPAFS